MSSSSSSASFVWCYSFSWLFFPWFFPPSVVIETFNLFESNLVSLASFSVWNVLMCVYVAQCHRTDIFSCSSLCCYVFPVLLRLWSFLWFLIPILSHHSFSTLPLYWLHYTPFRTDVLSHLLTLATAPIVVIQDELFNLTRNSAVVFVNRSFPQRTGITWLGFAVVFIGLQ